MGPIHVPRPIARTCNVAQMNRSGRIHLMARHISILWEGGIYCDSRRDLSPKLIGSMSYLRKAKFTRLTDKSSRILREKVIPSLPWSARARMPVSRATNPREMYDETCLKFREVGTPSSPPPPRGQIPPRGTSHGRNWTWPIGGNPSSHNEGRCAERSDRSSSMRPQQASPRHVCAREAGTLYTIWPWLDSSNRRE